MQKYFTMVRIILAQYFVYRLTFIMWRCSTVLNILLTFFLWHALYSSKATIFSYTKEQMLTYILVTSITASFVLTTRTGDFSGEIVTGDVINYLLKPLPFFAYISTRELTFKILNLLFGAAEIIILYLLFKPPVFIQTNLAVYPFVFLSIIIGSFIAFFISFSVSLIAFWSSETWAPRFVYMVLLSLLAGTLFPLDILPKPLFTILSFTPFPYLLYMPAKLYLTGDVQDFLMPFTVSALWMIGLYFIMKIIWKKGLQAFSFYGR